MPGPDLYHDNDSHDSIALPTAIAADDDSKDETPWTRQNFDAFNDSKTGNVIRQLYICKKFIFVQY